MARLFLGSWSMNVYEHHDQCVQNLGMSVSSLWIFTVWGCSRSEFLPRLSQPTFCVVQTFCVVHDKYYDVPGCQDSGSSLWPQLIPISLFVPLFICHFLIPFLLIDTDLEPNPWDKAMERREQKQMENVCQSRLSAPVTICSVRYMLYLSLSSLISTDHSDTFNTQGALDIHMKAYVPPAPHYQ